jgi:hypothetical protein
MVGPVEQVRVDLQGDARVGVAGLLQPCTFDRLPEALADVAVVQAAPARVAEDEVTRRLASQRSRRPLGSPGARITSRLPAPVLSGACFALAGELPVDADQASLVVDVGSGETERFADPQARVGEELEQWPVTSAGMSE